MAEFTFEAQPRTVVGKKVRQLRNEGLVPIVVYGPKIEPMHLQVPYRPLELVLMNAGGTNLIDVTVSGKTQTVVAREVQRDILKGTILHADFFAVSEDMVITTEVHITYVGESPVVASREGILLPGTTSLSIETLPKYLVNQIEVDLSGLTEIGAAVHVRDLDLGEHINILNDPEEMIVRVAQPAAARAEEEGTEEEGMEEEGEGEVEVIGRGKREDEEED
ncbi:MAG: 50S ribosomal protein L25 [Anaerolineae bacterium]|nr:50S ribosomal protein L25 [Anaerolineae bacterium]